MCIYVVHLGIHTHVHITNMWIYKTKENPVNHTLSWSFVPGTLQEIGGLLSSRPRGPGRAGDGSWTLERTAVWGWPAAGAVTTQGVRPACRLSVPRVGWDSGRRTWRSKWKTIQRILFCEFDWVTQ